MIGKRKIRAGIIGTGWIAHAHMEAYAEMDDVEIIALCDIIDGKAEAFAESFKLDDAHCYTDYRDMFEKENLDAVSICTYNTTHAECAIYALGQGVHVLLEKPMTVTLEEAKRVREAEEKSGCVLSIGFQPRYAPMMGLLRDTVRSGALGEVYYVQTGGGRRRGIPNGTFIEKRTAGIGALADIGCYSLDMVLYALDYPKPITVSAYKSGFFGSSTEYQSPENAARFDVDDFAAAFIRFEGGLVIDFRISWAMHMDTSGDTLMLGKKGGLRIPSTECWNYGPGGAMTLYHDIAGKCVETILPEIKAQGKHNLFYSKVRSFLDAVRDDLPSPIPTSQIIINQAILDGIEKSAEAGREIEINI